MPPALATLVFAVFIAGLFVLDRRPPARACPGLWVPVIWLSIAASRMVSTWLQITPVDDTDVYLEGSPIDRIILTALLAAGVLVLVARRHRVQLFLRENGPLVFFFAYCAVSVLWSDYPDVAIKRWMKAVGDLVMVMVVVTDRDPGAAIRRLLTRVGFLVIPISLLLIKYYPDLGRGYNRWTWTMYYSGVSYGKNGLGYVCMIFGLASLWRMLVSLWPDEGHERAWGSVIAHSFIVGIALWLFAKVDSATSLGCFVLGGAVLVVTSLPAFKRHPVSAHAVIGGVVVVGLAGLLVTAGMNVAEAMGRDTTLTGRTDLWQTLLQVRPDPLFGSGFESFWLGDRVDALWAKYWWHPVQAHNGYLEMFLNLGVAGLLLLAGVLAWGYRNAAAALWRTPEVGRLRLAFFLVAIAYNLTEAAFKMMHPVWIVLLLVLANPPAAREESFENSREEGGGADGTFFSSDARMIA